MNVLGLGFVFIFLSAFVAFLMLGRRKGARPVAFRDLEAYDSLPVTVGRAVETGNRLHVSLGTGALGGMQSATALAGLAVLDQVSDAAAMSDKPPIVTTGDGLTAILAEDSLRTVFKRQNALARYDPNAARVAGTDPQTFSMALTGLMRDESVAGTILVGSVGPEVVLLTEAGRRANITTLAGSDDPIAQAALFAAADHPLIGEDLFAGGAYIVQGAPAHTASLRAQDLIRLVVGAAIVLGTLLATVGIHFP